MAKIGRNDPCPCGSGKKYKKCCGAKKGITEMSKYRYDRYLQIRNSATQKIYEIAEKEMDCFLDDSLEYLYQNLLLDVDEQAPPRDEELFDNIVGYMGMQLMVFGLPIESVLKSNPDSISDCYLWKYCLKNFGNLFSEDEKKFMERLKQGFCGFFKVIDIEESPYNYPVVLARDLLGQKTFRIMDRMLAKQVVKHDIICGIACPYEDSHYIMECPAPVSISLEYQGLIEMLIGDYCRDFKKKYKKYLTKNMRYSKVLNLFPAILFLVVLDYCYYLNNLPEPKMVNRDREEIRFSVSNYKIKDRKLTEEKILALKGMELVEKDNKKTTIHWLNQENTILGTVYVKKKEISFETNSVGRLERWKKLVYGIPMELKDTEFTSLEELKNRSSAKERAGKVQEELDIPEKEFKEFALGWWDKHYEDWISNSIPALDGLSPEEAVKDPSGRQEVEKLIDEYENHALKEKKKNKSQNLYKYFDADEIRKRLGIKE
ncbi:MAG: SEC-C metal-binding domain-containing protein [Candidatus Humimicrobiaceae bacterium]